MRKTFLSVLFALCGSMMAQTSRMDLSGLWRFQMDPMGFGKTPGSELYLAKLTETITLPGTTDEAGKGVKNVVAHVDRLSRKYEYCGQAWYQREVVIPEDWQGRDIILSLERCHWETTVYVDGRPIATDERLSSPNRFYLTGQLTPGMHTITLCVDNRLKYPMDQWAHGTTEYTQTNWNGVVGSMELIARPANHIARLDIYPDIADRKATVCLNVHPGGKAVEGTLALTVREKGGKVVCSKETPVSLSGNGETLEEEVIIGKGMKLWDEFSPSLYELTAALTVGQETDSCTETFGMREVEQGKHHVRVNGRDVHLRGVLDCCSFPLTGYPPTTVEPWLKVMNAIKDHGMNHIRFHSWCPPEAAFDAADQLGMYLQVELPMWIKDVGRYPARRDFFEKEMYALLNEYGNHPSFILYCNGNENEGNFDVLEDLIKKGQAHDNRHLYSASTARTHVAADQYFASHVAAKVGDPHKQGITVYEGWPNTDWDKNKESDIDVPVIAHETGQRCMYPNFNEMKKYTGVLEPRNFKVYQDRLARNGMLHQADDFFRATGAHTVLQYKEVNESLLRSSKSGGFQLLGLSDFPGQGCAFVGVLDAFWESKGLVTPEKFRESCAPVVLLARMPKRDYTDAETFTAKMHIYQFGPENIRKGNLSWSLEGEAGDVVAKGRIPHGEIALSTVDSLGMVSIPLNTITKAGKYTLKASIANGVRNEWDIWVYPTAAQPATKGYTYVKQWSEARELLQKGENVLLVPQKCPGRKTHFASHFWNPIMFNWAPLIVGTLIDNDHPALADFPTSYYADWQWWNILNYSTAMDLTALTALTPIIQSVDTYEENRKLGISFEATVGQGKLFVLCADDSKDIDKRPAMRQLLLSVRNYVASDKFAPATALQLHELDAIFTPAEAKDDSNKNNAAVKQLLNQ